uniref:Squalene monooxygenase n=1 Tax=Botryococcus braunii TaxID=38881 RepID=A0A0E4FJ73_BOTBR|nr:squalene 2,3-epoxidase [Botryococcus braunii]|eukprot:jgi/Botrbrau1/17255/Bobra.0015s0014.1
MQNTRGASVEEDLVLVPTPSSNVRYEEDPEIWDLIIVGAGVSGSALAHSQGLALRRVLLLERDLRQPDRVVGEVMQPGGLLRLKDLGLDHCLDRIDAQQILGACMFFNGEEANLPYPIPAHAFHHGRFVQRLRHAAAAHANVTLRQAIVTSLLNVGGSALGGGESVGGVLYRSPDGLQRRAMAHLTVACDGMYSNLRPKLTDRKVDVVSYVVAVTLSGIKLERRQFIQIYLAEPLFSIYALSSSEARVMVTVSGSQRPSCTAALQDFLLSQVAPNMPRYLLEPFLLAVKEGHFRTLQTKTLAAEPQRRKGVIMLGDSLNMRHPITGGGMTMALNDTKLLKDMLVDVTGVIRQDHIARESTLRFLNRRKPLSAVMNMLANLVYKVFAEPGGISRQLLRESAFGYLARGGWCSRGFANLLGGLDERPYMVLVHSFGVAGSGILGFFSCFNPLTGLLKTMMMLWEAIGVLWPIQLAEGGPAIFFPFWNYSNAKICSSLEGQYSELDHDIAARGHACLHRA